jgi:hypothetical protein
VLLHPDSGFLFSGAAMFNIDEFQGSFFDGLGVEVDHNPVKCDRVRVTEQERKRLALQALEPNPVQNEPQKQTNADLKRIYRALRALRKASAEASWDKELRPIEVFVQCCVDAGLSVDEYFA